jgi:hypothetical protein
MNGIYKDEERSVLVACSKKKKELMVMDLWWFHG